MWPVAVTYIALVGIVLVSLWILLQFATWRIPRKAFTNLHKRIRFAESCVLLLLLGVIALGGLIDYSHNLLALIFIWGACTILVLLLVIFALLDVRETLASYMVKFTELSHGLREEEKKRNQQAH